MFQVFYNFLFVKNTFKVTIRSWFQSSFLASRPKLLSPAKTDLVIGTMALAGGLKPWSPPGGSSMVYALGMPATPFDQSSLAPAAGSARQREREGGRGAESQFDISMEQTPSWCRDPGRKHLGYVRLDLQSSALFSTINGTDPAFCIASFALLPISI